MTSNTTAVKQSSAIDVFDFPNHFFHRLAEAHDLAAPIQMELQPGLHCDLYKCPHCYGFGQRVMPGEPLTSEELDRALADIEAARPTIILSGVTTEPLTHPDAAGLIRTVRRRKLPLGLYTKGRRLDASIRQALLEGDSETFVTISLDGVTREEYISRHGIIPASQDGLDGTPGQDYFDLVRSNIAHLKRERDALGSTTQIRAAFLLFADNSVHETVSRALDVFGDDVDLLRFAFPQMRNDGELPGDLPDNGAERLNKLAKDFAYEPKVRILTATDRPTRNRSFNRCRAQRFQLVIDKAGNVFPCPEVAAEPYRHLSYGNIRAHRLADLLIGESRRKLFDLDVDRDMRCRICNRKDDAINTALETLSSAFGSNF